MLCLYSKLILYLLSSGLRLASADISVLVVCSSCSHHLEHCLWACAFIWCFRCQLKTFYNQAFYAFCSGSAHYTLCRIFSWLLSNIINFLTYLQMMDKAERSGPELTEQTWTSDDMCLSCRQPFSDMLLKVTLLPSFLLAFYAVFHWKCAHALDIIFSQCTRSITVSIELTGAAECRWLFGWCRCL